jgi:hypothetical protein
MPAQSRTFRRPRPNTAAEAPILLTTLDATVRGRLRQQFVTDLATEHRLSGVRSVPDSFGAP